MNKISKALILSFFGFLLFLLIFSYFVIKEDSLFNQTQINFVKKYFLPYRTISQQENIIINQKKILSKQDTQLVEINKNLNLFELVFKKNNSEIKTKKLDLIELTDGYNLIKYKLTQGFYAGIHNIFPGSGYLDFHHDNLIILSSRGVLGYSENLDNKRSFNQIRNNINEFIGLEQFNKSKNQWFSLKDLKIYKDKIFVSYTEEIKTDCWNTSIISGDINYKKIIFKKLFSSKECIHAYNNIDGEFNAHQSGGRIIIFDDKNILLTVGEYRSRYLAQKKDNINGKVIKINTVKNNYKIISMGNRNPQGLYLDKENNFILETEHGPMGGDEINLIKIEANNVDEIPNYGWPIVSKGEHYGGKVKSNKKRYEMYPLYKSHKAYGFIEPLKSFVPSIGISEITKIKKNSYVVSSLKDESLYFFEISDNKIVNLKRLEVFERIRDMIFKDNKLYLFLEDTPSIGIIQIN